MAYPDDARQAGNYTGGIGNVTGYDFSPGTCVLPIAEDPPTIASELATYSPVVVLKLHAPYRVKKFTQVAGKESNPPPIVGPGDTGAFMFLGGSVEISPQLNTTYRNYDWMVSAEYRYIENCAVQDEDGNYLGLVLGTQPYKIIMDRENELYGYSPTPYGATKLAGRAALVGYHMGQTIVDGTGTLIPQWGYNSQAFYPATLFYSDLANGGQPVSQGG